MDIAEHVAALEQEGIRLAAAATDLDADIPPCPQWTVRDAVVHTGGVHRWAASIVRDRLAVDLGPTEDELAKPGTRDPIEWFREGHAELVKTLRDADSTLECVTFLPAPSPLAFWARRQAHETAIHRADAESARGPVTPYEDAFANDGIDEMLTGFAARRRRTSAATPRTLALRPGGDDGWLVTFTPDGIKSVPGMDDAECAVSGTASDVYLWLWHRPANVQISGEPAVADLWQAVRVRWS
jgi:uncharacterized protein (TIGR03083 family)